MNANDTTDDKPATEPTVEVIPPKARELKDADKKKAARKARPSPLTEPKKAKAKKATTPGRISWILRRPGKEDLSIADWARSEKKKPFNVRQALRKAIGEPRVVTWDELNKALKTPAHAGTSGGGRKGAKAAKGRSKR